jgi:signal transduction histidine kinase
MQPQKHPERDPAKRVSVLYVIALLSIALVALVSQVIVRRIIESQQSDSRVINLSGRQRMLSQRLAKTFLLAEAAAGEPRRDSLLREIALSCAELAEAQRFLSDSGGASAKNPNSEKVQALYSSLQPYFERISRACALAPGADSSALALGLRQMLEAEPPFLALMEQITRQYEAEARQRVERLKSTEQFLFLLTLLILLVEGLLILTPAVRKIRLYFSSLRESNQALQQAGEELRESRRLLLSSVIESQEGERKRISMELHDGLGPLIGLARLNVSQVQGSLGEAEAPYAERALAYLDQMSAGLRQIAISLVPPVLAEFGLRSALESLAEELQAVCPAVLRLYVSLPEASLPPAQELHIYRIAQELLNNAARHAGAGEISLQVFSDGPQIVILAEDDGKGLRSTDPERSRGFGLKHVASRVNMLSGSLQIDSSPGGGTSILIFLPILPHGTDQDPARG